MFSKNWWKSTLDRAVKTAAQTFIVALGTDQLGWLALNWGQIGVFVGISTLLSFATSIASTPFGVNPNDPQLL